MQILMHTLEIRVDPACKNEDLLKHCPKGLAHDRQVCECHLQSSCVTNKICGKFKVYLAVWYSLSFQLMYNPESQ